jgi:chromosome segregation ATPase
MARRRQARVDKTDERESAIPGKMAERGRSLEERGARREARRSVVVGNGQRIMARKVEKVVKKIEDEATKSDEAQKVHGEEIAAKIEEERRTMEKRIEAARMIFAEREERRRDYERMIEMRDLAIEDSLSERERETREKFAAERDELEKKTAAVRMARGANHLSTIARLRQKLARNSQGIEDVRKKRNASQEAIAEAEERFAAMRAEVLGILPTLVEMDDTQRIRTFMDVLKISEEEATEIVTVATEPANIH